MYKSSVYSMFLLPEVAKKQHCGIKENWYHHLSLGPFLTSVCLGDRVWRVCFSSCSSLHCHVNNQVHFSAKSSNSNWEEAEGKTINVVNPVSTFNQCSQLCAAMENTAIRGTSQHKPNLLLRAKGVDFNTKDRKGVNTEFREHVGCAGKTRSSEALAPDFQNLLLMSTTATQESSSPSDGL